MQKILVFGAGRSAFYTIQYLLEQSLLKGYKVTIADSSLENLQACTAAFPYARIHVADVHDDNGRRALMAEHTIVISLLPARFHILVARDCAELGLHLITPSYTTPELQELKAEVLKKGLIFINELGLDPGIDHMSAMAIIDRLHAEGAEINSFRSYCGGLMAPGSDDNPFRYKLSWNPYNVIRAGQDGGLCKMHGSLRYLPYHRLFREAGTLRAGNETYDGYLNRNSLNYIHLYKLESAHTFLRGTLRYSGFSSKWHLLLALGLTTDRNPIEIEKPLSWPEYLNFFLPPGENLGQRVTTAVGYAPGPEDMGALNWLLPGAPDIKPGAYTPAEILQTLLEEKWHMRPEDNDRVVMIHEFEYRISGKSKKLTSWMDICGEDAFRTAMAKTVGLPLALAAELIADGKISGSGMLMPTERVVYEPLLEALAHFGIRFHEEETE